MQMLKTMAVGGGGGQHARRTLTGQSVLPKAPKFNNFVKRDASKTEHQLFDETPAKKIFSSNCVISRYVKVGSLAAAREALNSMAERSAVTWTILIGGYCQKSCQYSDAYQLFVEMLRWGTRPDYVTLVTLLSGCCSDPEHADYVMQLHNMVVKMGFCSTINVSNTLVDSYCKVCRLESACKLFDEMPDRDAVSFNSLISGFSKEGLNVEAVKLFKEMLEMGLRPSDFSFAAILSARNVMEGLVFGQQVHAFVTKTAYDLNVFVANALLDYYSKRNCVESMRRVFEEMPERAAISYNVVISSYARDGCYEESVALFRELQFTEFERKQFPLTTMLSIAANQSDLRLGREVHGQAILTTADLEIQVGNALVDMYAKCGRFEEAEVIFASLEDRSSVPWTAMISGYVQQGLPEEGLRLFINMRRASVSVDQVTFASILKASANLALPSLGKQVHSLMSRVGCLTNVFCGSSLLDMYAKCGSLKDALSVFREMPERNTVSWNALITACSQNGEGDMTIKLFDDMVQSDLKPDSVSLLSVLTACSHGGFIEKGLQYFNSMSESFKVEPRREHYSAMIDILCRSGRFDEAEKLMTDMPYEPDEILWTAVLKSCRIHKKQDLARKAAGNLFNMELRDAGAYVNMSNIYAEAAQWDNAGKVKKAMRDRGMKKVPAFSWVEINQQVHTFSANDRIHPQINDIREKIDLLTDEMNKKGYKPDTSCASELYNLIACSS